MSGAPDVITEIYQKQEPSNPAESINQRFAAQQALQYNPVYGPSFQFSVPGQQFNRGWVSPDKPNNPSLNYEIPKQAPPVLYTNLSYSNLIQSSYNPPQDPNRQINIVTAPAIQTS